MTPPTAPSDWSGSSGSIFSLVDSDVPLSSGMFRIMDSGLAKM